MADNGEDNVEKRKRGRPKRVVPSDSPNVDELNEALEEHSGFRSKAEKSLKDQSKFEDIDDGTGAKVTNNLSREEEGYDFGAGDEDADAIPTEETNPLEEAVIINDYHNETIPTGNPTAQPQAERIIPEPIINPTPINKEPAKDDKANGTTGGDKEPEKKPEKPQLNPDFEDLSPSARRKNAEKDAEAIVTTWANFLPSIPKRMASFNMPKLERMEMKGEIVLSTQVFDDGTTFRQYCEKTNENVEETFKYTQDMRDAVKEPLVEVLLEKGVAMTPMQRLIKVGIEQALQFGVAAFQMMQDNKSAINQMTEFMKSSRGGDTNTNPPENKEPVNPPQNAPTQTYERPVEKQKEETQAMEIVDVLEVHDNTMTIEEIIPAGEEENQ